MLVDDAGLARLHPCRFRRLEQLDETGSTNAVALARAAAGEPEGLVVVADHQTAGRGRFDRRWEAPAGTSLLFSVLMRPGAVGLPVGCRHLAVAALSLAVTDAVRRVASVELVLKWPNDLLAGGAGPGGRQGKVAGLLAEATGAGAGDAVVVGAGVNVAWAPEALGADCLGRLAGGDVDRGELLVATLLELDRLYGHWDLVGHRYSRECATLGHEVVVDRGGGRSPLRGTAEAVDDAGHLVVRTASGAREVVAAGDVVHASAVRPPNLHNR